MVILHRLAKGGASLVGLGQEAYASRQQKKSDSLSDQGGSDGDKIDLPPRSRSDDPPPPYESERNVTDSEPLCTAQRGPHDSLSQCRLAGLPAPIIIPQRRPEARSRGFIHAWAPALEDCGIGQDEFLNFLSGFRREGEKGAAFNAVNLAIATTDWAIELATLSPSPSMHFAALAAHLSIEGGKKLYINKKTNEYLNNMNEIMFKPHGLFAMIMTYDPATKATSKTVDFSTQTAAAVNDSSNSSLSTKFQTASADTLEAQIPEVCSLEFPGEDHSNESGFTRSVNFTKDYYDRRSQAAYAAKHPDSTLNAQDHDFAGRYADPTTFQDSCLLGVLTNGTIDPRANRQKRRAANSPGESREKRGGGGLISSVKGKLGQRVLYLLIVNLPSEEEMEYAARIVAKAEARQE